MKTIARFVLLLSLGFVVGARISTLRAAAQAQKSEPVIVIEGLDPVLLVQGKEVQGNEKISAVRGKFKYIFASEENKVAFEKDPTKYEAGEYCQRMGAPVTGNPDLHAEYKGKIYLFGSDSCIRAFQASPEEYLEPARDPWKATRAETSRGQALLKKAVAAMGGAHVLDHASSFREMRMQKLKRRDGTEYETTTEILRADLGGLRQVEVRSFGKVTSVFTGVDGFIQFESRGSSNSEVRPAPSRAREIMETALLQDPYFLLQARTRPDFRVAARGAGKVGESAVEWVDAEARSQRFTLGIDPASGKLLSMALVTRGPGGKFGNLLLQFGEFRSNGGLNFPHRTDAQFNGQPLPDRSYTVAEVAVNQAVDRALFEKPRNNP